MNVNIQTVHFDADAKLLDYVSQKVKKLDTFHDKIIKVDVFLKLDNVVHTIKDKIVEIRVHVPKYDFFVKASSKSFEESFDSAMESMINQIKRKKRKTNRIIAPIIIKESLRISGAFSFAARPLLPYGK